MNAMGLNLSELDRSPDSGFIGIAKPGHAPSCKTNFRFIFKSPLVKTQTLSTASKWEYVDNFRDHTSF